MELKVSKISIEELRSPKKIWRHLPERKIIYELDNVIPPPISIEIQPTSACNLRCKWCSYWDRNGFDSKRSNYLNLEIIEKIITFSAKNKIKSIYLAGGGEPCIYPFIKNVVEKINKAGISLAIITNGTLFAEKLLDVANYFSYLQVSIISCNPEEYFSVTNSNKGFFAMQELPKKIKDIHAQNAPIIGGMYVLTEWNYKNAFKVINFCQEKQFDYCSFRFAVDYENRGVALPDKCYDFLRNGIEKFSNVDSTYTNLEKLLNSVYPRNYKPNECLNTKYGLFTTVDTKGNVYLCVPDIGKEELSIGSLKNQTFEEIWNSEKHKIISKTLDLRYMQKECHGDCRAHGYNEMAKNNPPDFISTIHSEFL